MVHSWYFPVASRDWLWTWRFTARSCRPARCGMWDWLLLLAWGQALLETFPAPGAVVRAGAITRASRDTAGTGTASRYLVFPMCSGLMVSILAASQSYRRNNEPGDQGDEASSFRSSVPLVPCPQRTGTFLLSPCSGTGRQAGRQGETCFSSIQSGLFIWSHDPYTRVRGRAGNRCGLQASALTLQHTAYWSCHSEFCVSSPSYLALHSVRREREARGPDSVSSVCPTLWLWDTSLGHLFVHWLFTEHRCMPRPVGDAGSADTKEVTPWSQGTHHLVWVTVCK